MVRCSIASSGHTIVGIATKGSCPTASGGVEYDDGSKVTTQDESPWATVESIQEAVVEGPVLEGLGRPSVDADSWSRFVWVRPTPPAPRMQVGLEWTARGIAEVVTSVDVTAIIEDLKRSGLPLGDRRR